MDNATSELQPEATPHKAALTYDAGPIFASIGRFSPTFIVVAVLLAAVAGCGVYAWIQQWNNGLSVTGLNRPVYWGIYIGNFVFFVSISLAGTMISALLRVVKAEWRRPITRCAELVTVLALVFAALNIVVDMGRPDRLLNVILHGHFKSPILWDVISVNSYLTASIIYLYLPLIPDMAILRDRGIGYVGLYRVLCFGYTGTARQRHLLERMVGVMALVIIPIGISVHTVTAYLFATTVQPVWHSTIYGPFFVVGALYTGTAVLIIVMAILRKTLGLQDILKDIHFNNLGLMIVAEGSLVAYFLVCIYLVEITGHEPEVLKVVLSETQGPFAIIFWPMVGAIVTAPVLLMWKKMRTVGGTVFASLLIIVAMYVERFLIVVPPLSHPRLPWPEGHYTPSLVEAGITIGCVAAFALLYMLFTRVFPIVSIWEVQEGKDEAIPTVTERYIGYMPPDAR